MLDDLFDAIATMPPNLLRHRADSFDCQKFMKKRRSDQWLFTDPAVLCFPFTNQIDKLFLELSNSFVQVSFWKTSKIKHFSKNQARDMNSLVKTIGPFFSKNDEIGQVSCWGLRRAVLP